MSRIVVIVAGRNSWLRIRGSDPRNAIPSRLIIVDIRHLEGIKSLAEGRWLEETNCTAFDFGRKEHNVMRHGSGTSITVTSDQWRVTS